MARINPNKVNILIENPKADMTASVPIRETGMVMQGDDNGTEILEEQENYQYDESCCFQEGDEHFVDGGIDYLCRVQCHIINDSFR